MAKKTPVLYPKSLKGAVTFGERLKDARLRRRFSMEVVCVRAGISKPTLAKIESGDPSVSLGAYLNVLRVLGLLDDLDLIAKEDALGRRLQDESLPRRKRAPKRKPVTEGESG
ncbi:MAG: hypothetical protein OHK0028_08690 [Deltaproteobacteria bacterium]